MTVRSGFFNSVNHDRVYDAAWFAEYFATFISNGVFPNPSTGLQVVEGTNMQTVVKPGKGWINGYYVVNDNDFIIDHAGADGTLRRIDRIVLQRSTANRAINIVMKKGNFASNPVAPAIIRDADFYELVLADVLIDRGATKIIQGNITDQRLNNALCGIVHGVVNQVDTTTIFNQYQSWFGDISEAKMQEFEEWQKDTQVALNDWINNTQDDFETWRAGQEVIFSNWFTQQQNSFSGWFNVIKDQLSTVDIGAHLVDEMPHMFTDETTGTIYKWGMGAENGIAFLKFEEV